MPSIFLLGTIPPREVLKILNSYNERLASALLGRRLSNPTSPVLRIMGDALGFPEGDVHATRFYRIFLTLDNAGIITHVHITVDGELISPCSGYFQEALDEFDVKAVTDWCLAQTEAV